MEITILDQPGHPVADPPAPDPPRVSNTAPAANAATPPPPAVIALPVIGSKPEPSVGVRDPTNEPADGPPSRRSPGRPLSADRSVSDAAVQADQAEMWPCGPHGRCAAGQHSRRDRPAAGPIGNPFAAGGAAGTAADPNEPGDAGGTTGLDGNTTGTAGPGTSPTDPPGR